jgi:hypothetical protein
MLIQFTAIWIILRTFGIFSVRLVHFVFIWYIFPFLVSCTKKIWQPCSADVSVRLGPLENSEEKNGFGFFSSYVANAHSRQCHPNQDFFSLWNRKTLFKKKSASRVDRGEEEKLLLTDVKREELMMTVFDLRRPFLTFKSSIGIGACHRVTRMREFSPFGNFFYLSHI